MGSPFCLGCLLSEVVRLFLDNSELPSIEHPVLSDYFWYCNDLAILNVAGQILLSTTLSYLLMIKVYVSIDFHIVLLLCL